MFFHSFGNSLEFALLLVKPRNDFLPTETQCFFGYIKNDRLLQVVPFGNHNGATDSRFSHDVMIATLAVKSATLVFTNLDKFFPANRAQEQPLPVAQQQYGLG